MGDKTTRNRLVIPQHEGQMALLDEASHQFLGNHYKIGARQTHSIRLQWKVHSDARTESFCPVISVSGEIAHEQDQDALHHLRQVVSVG